MEIKGRYKTDSNFITVYANNRIYTIARNTGDWGAVGVGDMTATGHRLTQEVYNSMMAECEECGTFTLS